MIPACPSLVSYMLNFLNFFLTRAILKEPKPRKCVFDVCVCMFCFIFV